MLIDNDEATKIIKEFEEEPGISSLFEISFDKESDLIQMIRANVQSGANFESIRVLPFSMFNSVESALMLLSDELMRSETPKVAELATMNEVLAEVLQNAVVHGSRFGEDGDVDVSIGRKGERVITMVSNPGKGFDYTKWPNRGNGHRVMSLASLTQVAFRYNKKLECFMAMVIGFRYGIERLMLSTDGVSH